MSPHPVRNKASFPVRSNNSPSKLSGMLRSYSETQGNLTWAGPLAGLPNQANQNLSLRGTLRSWMEKTLLMSYWIKWDGASLELATSIFSAEWRWPSCKMRLSRGKSQEVSSQCLPRDSGTESSTSYCVFYELLRWAHFWDTSVPLKSVRTHVLFYGLIIWLWFQPLATKHALNSVPL